MRIIVSFFLSFLVSSMAFADMEALTQSEDQMIYSNATFGLSVNKPKGWYSADIEELLRASYGDKTNVDILVQDALASIMPLFAFSRFPPSAPVLAFNANIIANAENVNVYPNVKTACDYLNQINSEQEMLNLGFKNEGGCDTVSIGNMTYSVVSTSVELNDVTVQLKYMACIKDNHAIYIAQSFVSDQELAMLDSVLKTLVVTCKI
jgi:hypothetical protein